MKNFRMMQSILILVMVVFLASGCAKKATEDTTTTTAAPAVTSQTSETVVTETPVKEAPVVAATVADLTRVHFDFDSYVLSDVARTTLKQNAQILKAAPRLKVNIEGHCDERGSDDYNLALGEQRAQAAMDYMRSLGVSADQMKAISMGEMMPLDRGSNEAAWAKNRRAEFKAQ